MDDLVNNEEDLIGQKKSSDCKDSNIPIKQRLRNSKSQVCAYTDV